MNDTRKSSATKKKVAGGLAAVAVVGTIAGVGVSTASADTTTPTTHQLVIKAHSDLANGVGAEMRVGLNGTTSAKITVPSTTDETFKVNFGSMKSTDEVDVFFDNDYVQDGQDRNLYISSMTLDGNPININSSAVKYDLGDTFPLATDGTMVHAGTGNMYANGALRFSASLGVFGSTPTPTPTPTQAPTTSAPTTAPTTTSPTTTPTDSSPFKGTVNGYSATQTMPEDINPSGDADGKFSIAVLPDTQEETSDAARGQKSSSGWQNIVNYINGHKGSDDIRMVTQVGDLNNWSEREPAQMTLTKTYLDQLHNAGLPFTVDIGNHDSGAVGSNNGPATDTTYGGAAYVANPLCLTDPKIHSDPYLIALSRQLGYGGETCKTRVLVRQTGVTNAALPDTYLGREINTWEPGKLDNSWSEFSAGGKKFAIMNLEFNARNEVVDWANQQISAHPDINFIISTHAYLNDDGSIRSDAEYGVNSGVDLTNKLISKHSNIKAVISGHVGDYNSRVDTYNGNKVASFLQTMHRTNPEAPIRMMHIDVANGTISTEIVNGADSSVYSNSATSVSGINFV